MVRFIAPYIAGAGMTELLGRDDNVDWSRGPRGVKAQDVFGFDYDQGSFSRYGGGCCDGA